MSGASAYVLVAISNLTRAAHFRQAAAESLSLEVVTVRDGDDALHEMGSRGVPAVLIVDLSLPRVDGFAVMRKLRRDTPEPDTRIVAVAAHESLRAAARELASPLGITAILPLDADATSLADVLQTLRGPEQDATAVPMPSHGALDPEIDDLVDRAAIEARRRSRMPIAIGYVKIGESENLTFHVTARDTGPGFTFGDVNEFRFLRQVADALDPLVIPNVESHPVFAQFLQRGPRPIRGFVAVPIATTRENIRAAFAVLDVKALTLNAADIDALSSFGREVGMDIDRALCAEVPARQEVRARTPVEASSDEVKALQHLAATDPLTGLANRRGGEKQITNEISRARREKKPLSCILLDIDRFKQVNDTFGHQTGDQLLRDVSHLLRRTVRAYDVLVRWGGEEFLLVLPGVDIELARVLAERIRVAVETLDTHGIGPVTISGGVATFENDYDFATTLKTADRRLYQAKASGRNRIV